MYFTHNIPSVFKLYREQDQQTTVTPWRQQNACGDQNGRILWTKKRSPVIMQKIMAYLLLRLEKAV
jgi:hypothetical protein